LQPTSYSAFDRVDVEIGERCSEQGFVGRRPTDSGMTNRGWLIPMRFNAWYRRILPVTGLSAPAASEAFCINDPMRLVRAYLASPFF
jgi:hypothetical protein